MRGAARGNHITVFKDVCTENGSSTSHNLAVTPLCVLTSLDDGLGWGRTLEGGMKCKTIFTVTNIKNKLTDLCGN